MHVAMVTHEPDGYGTYLRCHGLARALARRGCAVTMICAGQPGQKRLWVRDESAPGLTRVSLMTRVRPAVVNVRYAFDDVFRGVIGALMMMSIRCDILHAFSVALCSVAIPSVSWRLLCQGRLIIDWGDDFGIGMAGSHHPLVHGVSNMLETKLLKLADHVTTVSAYLEERTVRCGIPRHRVHRLWHGMDVEDYPQLDKLAARSRFDLPYDAPLIVVAGSTWTGGMEYLLHAMKPVSEHIPDVRLYIIGRMQPPPGRKWEPVRRAYDTVARNTVLLDRMPRDDILMFLSAADALVIPMEDSIMDRSRLPLRLGESIASGRPIVSNAVGDTRDVLSRCGRARLCQPDDVVHLAELLIEVLRERRATERSGLPLGLPSWDDQARRLVEDVYARSK